MNGEVLVFLILASLAVIGGLLMLNLKKVVHMLLSLVLTFLSIAGLFIMLSAEFVAVVQVLIYSGAVTIMMIFGIMLTRHQDEQRVQKNRVRTWVVLIGILVFFYTMYEAITRFVSVEQASELHIENTKQIGMALYAKYVIPFELTSVLLLVALIGAIVLAKREEEEEVKQE
ncbi:NADH-quinone oxidoreductase subunit J [Thalassobacillus sp. CUG 92003]|uniref:NADH-quinone oxidoreductase subunit J n=1 Tax=Thalassobacillus sp. CUG 92003 TaxID=2736641 RepID=UPI0015E69067|nr:NADH-quinone oxidoreductase subunit J [Thalassobacillus sp. CUG 92003]